MRLRILLSVVLCLAGGLLRAQARPAGNINDMLLDVMRTDLGKGREGLAMWIPREFFLAAGQNQAPGTDPAAMEKELSFLSEVTVFMVRAKAMSEDGPINLTTAQLRAHTTLTNEAGQSVKALKDLPPRTEAMLNLVRQGMASSGGGEFRLLVFPLKDAAGKPFLAGPTRRGQIRLQVEAAEGFPGMTLVWKTPLSAYVQPVHCAKCGESLQAAWSFCPWCGTAVAAK